jgi:hypothetical protein
MNENDDMAMLLSISILCFPTSMAECAAILTTNNELTAINDILYCSHYRRVYTVDNIIYIDSGKNSV